MRHSILLRADNLSVGYHKPVLGGINFELEQGQFVALLGPNGAGKTTLLRTLSRHIPPLGGQVFIEKHDLSKIKALDLARIVAVCLTDNAKPPLLSVSEFVALGRYPHTGFMGKLTIKDAGIVGQSLAAVDAENLAERMVEELSDGERQKAVLARALAQEPRLMLLDEPTAHLDLKHRVEVMGILRSLCHSKGLTVLASLHDIDIASKVADRVMLVRDGAASDYGLPEAVLTREKVTKLYGFDAIDFDGRLGGIEFRSSGLAGKAFVIAGGGTGAQLFRLLSKKGMSIHTGVLTEGDLDSYVATALGATTFVRIEREKQSSDALHAALAILADCDFVVDCGTAGPEAEAIRSHSSKYGLPYFRVARQDRSTGDNEAGHGHYCASLAELSSAIDHLKASRHQAVA